MMAEEPALESRFAIRKALAEFKDPVLEAEYQLHRFSAEKRQTVVVASLYPVAWMVGIVLDLVRSSDL